MPYGDGINWPTSIDSFPSLRDNNTPAISEDQILFAEHYNKLGNFIKTAQIKWTNTTVASGDGSIQSIYFPSDPSLMGFIVPLNVVARISCPWAYDGRSIDSNGFPIKNIPGNILPFEFVLSRDISFMLPWSYQSYRMAYQTTNVSAINSFLKGFSYTNYPRFQVSLWDSSMIGASNTPIQHKPNTNFVLNSWGIMGAQTFIVRGSIVDMSGTSPGGGLELWDLYPSWNLVCVYQGIRNV